MIRPAISLILGVCIAAALVFSCKKDEEPEEESPFFEFFNDDLVEIDTTPVAADSWEYGFAFTPLRSGKVSRLGLKLPTTGTFEVRLWNLSGPSDVLLKTVTITSLAEHEVKYVNIPPVTVPEGVKLGITIRANSFYRIQKKNGSSFVFPRVVRNIRVESFHETLSAQTDSFPSMMNDKRVAPCVNVIFIAE